MSKALDILRDIRGEADIDENYELFGACEEVIKELEELELFKSEHLRLEAELNTILHPNGDGPTAPSFCDLVAYVRADLKPKTCDGCEYAIFPIPNRCHGCVIGKIDYFQLKETI